MLFRSYLVQVRELQQPRWLYVVVWLVQIFVALGTIKFVSGPPRTEESPIEPINKRIWTMFLFLCINISVLNVVSGQPIFVFMPAMAALSAFGFTFMTSLISRRFMAAGIVMFATGILMAKFRSYEFLIYGAGWLVVLQTVSVILWQRRNLWLSSVGDENERESHQAAEPAAGEFAAAGIVRQ